MMKWRPGRVVRVGGARGERRRAAATLAAGLLVATLAVGGAYAFLSSVPAPIVNVFDPAKVDVHIDEKLDDGVKSDVALANTGDVDAWMRATFAISWTDEGGNVVGRQPWRTSTTRSNSRRARTGFSAKTACTTGRCR